LTQRPRAVLIWRAGDYVTLTCLP